jgi:hypothetical protein
MDTSPPKSKLPLILLGGSFLAMMFIIILTRPVEKIGIAIVFFASLLLFLISGGYLIIRLQLGAVSARHRSRIIIISAALVLLLMFRSAQSLGLVDALVLIIITTSLLFYSSHRTPIN